MTLATRTAALLALVDAERARQCAALVGEAEAAAATQRSRSRAEARQRLHETFADERARCTTRTAAARAELRTRQRLHEQRHLDALLTLAWQALPGQLATRWQDAAARRAWVRAALLEARRVFAPGGWQLTHAPGLDTEALSAELAAACGEAGATPVGPVECRCDESIAAGLRIAAGGNVLDATTAGLLADRAEIGGRLVGLLQPSATA